MASFSGRCSFLLKYAVLVLTVAEAALPASTTRIVRQAVIGDDATVAYDEEDDDLRLFNRPAWCKLEPHRSLVLSHPASLHPSDRFYGIGSLSWEAAAMTVEHINDSERCGVSMGGRNYSVTLQTLGDESDPDQHAAIGRYLAKRNRTDFFLGGYSSGLTQHLAKIAQENAKVLVAGGSSRPSIYEGNDYAFAILPPNSLYADLAIQATAQQGAKTVGVVAEEDTSTCTSILGLADKHGLQVVGEVFLPADPDLMSHLVPAARNLSKADPDVVVSCTFGGVCGRWIRAMREIGWTPRAQVFPFCVGDAQLEAEAGQHDLEHVLGTASWHRVFPDDIQDAVTGWTPREFADLFLARTYKNASYQHAAASAAVTVLVQALERTHANDAEVDGEKVVKELARKGAVFPTVYGEVVFDEHGQNKALSLVLQYDQDGGLNVVYPSSRVMNATDNTTPELIYPMPAWGNRDCVGLSSCSSTNGTCLEDGTCDCSDLEALLSPSERVVGLGSGASAYCKVIPNEDMSYVPDVFLNVGIALVFLQGFLSLACISWTFWNRHKVLVMASQPFFLILVAIGCFVLSSSIIPLTLQGEYRYERDPLTGQVTNIPNEESHKLDAACMAWPWLAGIGFAIVFSALFAKIWRVRRMLHNAEHFVRKAVQVTDVLYVMVGMLVVEAGLLLAWQLASPLTWQREILLVDSDGFTLKSVGKCQSDQMAAFVTPICVFNTSALLFALWLCYATRNVSDDLAESKWITISIASIFQILILAIPVFVIADDNRLASFFLRAVVVFVMSSSVTLFVFVPKVVRVWTTRHEPQDARLLTTRHSRLSTTISSARKLPRLSINDETSSRFGVGQSFRVPQKLCEDSIGQSQSEKRMGGKEPPHNPGTERAEERSAESGMGSVMEEGP